MSDDEPAEEQSDEAGEDAPVPDVSAEDLDARLEEAAESLDAADTEADLDGVEATLDGIEADLEAADLPEPDEDDEDAEDPREELESRLSDVRSDLEDQRGPYASDVVADVEEAATTVRDTRWTEGGESDLPGVVSSFLADVNETLGSDLSTDAAEPDALADDLEGAAETVEGADLDADDDAGTIAALLEATDALESDLEDVEEWGDLETHEQLRAQGFYDVLGHYKDFPPEWAALKEWEKRGNVEMVLLALDSLQSDFMERHALEAITRMNDGDAFEAMHQRAGKRDQPAIRALGKMAAEDAVETLVEYVDSDSNPALQKVTFKALGEIGHEDAVQPLANKLVAENDEVRPYAARALGLLGDTRAIEPLADVAADDDSDAVRAAALWALRQIGTEAALEAAAEHGGDRSFIVQTEAEKARDALDSTGSEGGEAARTTA
ncbi:HEAT repeat domain-containing protein [Halorarum salinum]|uniref:HEAT repeat domain-containing protein n=1 Tax=Halorarum salinum TaxID=2743089 RepID=A0A7D5LBL7_9EURY|nr:HEAT repeat domain-containing protein [Halobaculum salinum]QLG62668.1 HEAT repeat domain-containing protein [Halobaculum salinum]